MSPYFFDNCSRAILVFSFLVTFVSAEEVPRSTTPDGRVSVAFPISLAEAEEWEEEQKTIAGKASTRVMLESEGGVTFSVSVTEFSPVAAALFGEKASLEKLRESLMGSEFNTEKKFYRYEAIEEPTVMVLEFDSAHPKEEGHPGYDGFSALLRLKNRLYVINSTISKETDEAAQRDWQTACEEMLKSIRIVEVTE